MPRGRKRSPQDSIDSILLAMSRRSDIDPDTLSHYFDRLDEEWTDGARDKVLHLLRTNDSAAHSAAVLILSELATDFDLRDLERFVADPTVSDIAKLTLAPVLKELGSDITDERIMDYLHDPEAAMLQMQTRLLDLVGQSELGVESVLEDVASMPVERRLSFIEWLAHSQDARSANLLIPLLENQPGKVVTAAVNALEQLGPVVAQQAIPALDYLIANSANRQLKQQARAVLGRLTMQLAPGMEDAVRLETRQQLPLYEARVSFIDGSGAQMIMLSWRRPDGLLKGVNLLYQDQWGIKDCYGTDGMEAEHWSELVEGIQEQGFINFQVSLEYCRALIAEARALNKRTRRKLPIAYSVWRPYIGVDEAHKKNAPLVSTMLEARPFNADLAGMAQRGDELYQMPEFESWIFEPLTDILPYINRYWVPQNMLEMFTMGPVRSGRGRKKGQKARKPNLEALVGEAVATLVDDEWRMLHEARLRRQGALFLFDHRPDDAALVSAVASALHPSSGLPPQDQPFLRTMMRLSIEGGPMRMMAEALEEGDFGLGPIPMDPFSLE